MTQRTARVLVIEDDPLNLELVTAVLESLDSDIVPAGSEARSGARCRGRLGARVRITLPRSMPFFEVAVPAIRDRNDPGTARLLLAVAAFTCGCTKPTPRALPPPVVVVVAVHPERVAETMEFAGEVQPVRRVEVRSPVAGVIVDEPIDEGAQVAAGTVLFRIDPSSYDAAFRGAQARLVQAQARFDNAARTLARLRPLLAEHAVAQRDVDDAESEEAAARAAVDDARSSVDRACKDLNDATVRAEIAGRVGKANMMLGARVTGPADLLTTIDVIDPVRVTFRPSTQQVLAWRRDPRATLALRAGGSVRVHIVLPDGAVYAEPGKLDFVAPVVDPSTGTEEFRAEVPNHQRLLVPGQFVRVRLEGLVRDSAILVPQRAVVQSLGRQSVYVLSAGDTVRSRDVHATAWIGERWLVDSGLVAGDRVIVDGLQKVRPGGVAQPAPGPPGEPAPGGRASAPAGQGKP